MKASPVRSSGAAWSRGTPIVHHILHGIRQNQIYLKAGMQ